MYSGAERLGWLQTMFIDEQPKETNVVLKVQSRGVDADFQTTILGSKCERGNHCIIVEAVKGESGNYIDFSQFPLIVEIVNPQDKRFYKYISVKHGYFREKEKVYFGIFVNDDVKPVNRREAYRVAISEPAALQIKGHTKVIDGYTHDVSATGISFTIPASESTRACVGDTVSASFNSSLMERFYRINCTVCRIEDFENERVLLGCRLTKVDEAVRHLVGKLSILECRVRKETKKAEK